VLKILVQTWQEDTKHFIKKFFGHQVDEIYRQKKEGKIDVMEIVGWTKVSRAYQL